jgi:hypothetical protein
MYYIKKYANCWAIHNDENGKGRKLTCKEVEQAKQEFPELKEAKVATVYSDVVKSIREKP